MSKINDRIDEVLQAQKKSTASVLEKRDDSLCTEEVPVGSLASEKAEKAAVSVSSSDESKAATEEDVVPEEIKEGELEVLSEDKAEVELESKEPIASSDEKAEDVLRVNEGDSADFDIQEFLEEVENLPSEKEPDSEK
ncbi:MAG: hypothetical protein GY909_01195 [Oligoflexia bacterium]|nr:hypothetical protein [Oligoflexia bacterium]